MSTTAIQSSSVPIYLSGNGSDYKMVVCKRGVTFNASSAITEEETDCGIIAGIAAVKWSFDIDAIVNLTPDVGLAVSYEDILSWVMNQSLIYVRFNHPDSAGSNFKHEGQVYLTNLRGQVQQGNAMNFTVTATGTGTLTIS